jgi:hypothetical protein
MLSSNVNAMSLLEKHQNKNALWTYFSLNESIFEMDIQLTHKKTYEIAKELLLH